MRSRPFISVAAIVSARPYAPSDKNIVVALDTEKSTSSNFSAVATHTG